MNNKKWVYLCLMRPPMPGAVPREGLDSVDFREGKTPTGHHYWGQAVYARKLTAEEIMHYDLEPCGSKMKLHLPGSYGNLSAGRRADMSAKKPRPPFIYEDNKEYQKEYQHSLKRILVSFNPRKEEDIALWEHHQSKGRKARLPYIKRLIREDMKKE